MSGFFFPGMGGGGGGQMPQGFPGMGGQMPGGMGDASEEGEEENTNFYELLGVEKSATQQQIKRAYRKLARELHPDKHMENKEVYEAKFQEVQRAHEVLSDPSKRKLYDRYGESGLRSGGGAGGSMSDIFDMFFSGHGQGHGGHSHGGGGGRRQQQQRRKAPVIRTFVDVTLRDLYLGSSKEIEYERMQVCKDCSGKGGKKVVECPTCHGTGRQVVIQRMGYMTMQTQRECPTCKGEGTSIPDKDRCKKCKGQGYKKQSRTMNFDIPRGSKHADKIVLHAQGHEIPDAANGDLVVVLRCTKHSTFNRIGADLAMTYNISLKQALCGYDVVIPHVSGKKLRLKSKAGEIVQHGQLKAVFNQGMPQKGSNVFGNLYVKFEIEFPKNGELDENTLARIKELLPKGENEEDSEDEHEEDNNDNSNSNAEQGQDQKEIDDEDGLHENIEDYEMHEEADDVVGEPSVTPASSRSAYDEDEEEQDAGGCRQM